MKKPQSIISSLVVFVGCLQRTCCQIWFDWWSNEPEKTSQYVPLQFDWQVISGERFRNSSGTPEKKKRWLSSNIWAAAARVQLTLSACSRVLNDIKQAQLTGEFTPDSNYTSGLLPFTHLTDILLTSGGACASEAPLWVNFYCFDWLSSSLPSSAEHKWGLIVIQWEMSCWSPPVFRYPANRYRGEFLTSVSAEVIRGTEM